MRRVHPTVKENEGSAVALGGHRRPLAADCTDFGLADGDAFCFDDPGAASYVVFCDAGQAYALDCATFSDANGTAVCGEIDDECDCVYGPTTTLDTSLLADLSYAATAQLYCAPEEEGDAECDGDYLVFCHNEGVWELDCTAFDDGQGNHAICGSLDSGECTCGFPQ